MIKYLETKSAKVSKLISPVINLNQVALPIKHTVWYTP